MKKIVIGLCGLTCSGKDYVIDILSKYGFKKYSYTEKVLEPIAIATGLPRTREVYRSLLTRLGYLADLILYANVMLDGTRRVGIPNIRLKSSIEFWRKKSGFEFYLGKVCADFQTRYERFILRKRHIDENIKNTKELEYIDRKDLEVTDLDKILKEEKFDFVIDNNGSKDELENKVEQIMKKVLG
jgi:dephospho-CoA kinase